MWEWRRIGAWALHRRTPVGYHYFNAGMFKIERWPIHGGELYRITVIHMLRIVSCGNAECLHQPARQHDVYFKPPIFHSCLYIPLLSSRAFFHCFTQYTMYPGSISKVSSAKDFITWCWFYLIKILDEATIFLFGIFSILSD